VKPDLCPNCGALVPPKARACPECGADEETGWSDRAQAQRLDLPDDDFNYDEFVREEFGDGGGRGRSNLGARVKPAGLHWVWWVVGILLVLAMLYGFISQF
jgi:hypothetical protein